jgi:hypothetical protein
MVNKIAIIITKAITPPSLFGIDHRIVYVNGSIIQVEYVLVLLVGLLGCTLGLPGYRVNVGSIIIVNANPRISFTAKYGCY